ncbi:MAG: polymer-forming cytoskeletal protein [Deltaproteobacteria bacterium]|nr:polymer-forming cytoskeletal protein [Deltaproteobacteria bacterium]
MWKKPNEEAVTGPVSFTNEEPVAERRKSNDRAVVGSAITIRGNIEGNQDLLIDGEVEGTVELRANTVTVGKSGRVRANVYAKSVIVEGDIRGDVFGTDQVIVHPSGSVRGNITAPRVTLEDGAKLKGSIDMDPQGTENAKRDEKSASKSEAAPSVTSSGKSNGAIHAPGQ